MSLESGTPIGKYVVRRKLAEGGMAEIYLCSVRGAEGFEKDVVIKRIRSFLSDDPQFVDMFIAEARLASRLNHANIVQIFDFDKHEDSFYLAMEYVRGKSLWDLRRRSRELMMPLPPTLVAHMGSEVARGLHYAHRLTERGKPLGLVHRDVTPHNVLLSFEGAVKLADFGIAKAGNKLTSPGMLKGKFAYMSPEQARGDDVDARTDVFALGIVLWEMLTGARLFDGDSDVAVLKAVQQSVIAPPARLNPEVHPDLDAVVMRALERDPGSRFQTAQELERALGQFILRNADSIEETDVGGFLRRLYSDELQLRGDGLDGTASGVSAPSQPTPAKREPTAVLPGSGRSSPLSQPVSPDEDVNASTWVVKREGALPPAPAPVDPALRPTLPARPIPLVQPVTADQGEKSAETPARPAASPVPAESTAVLQARVRRSRGTRIGIVAGAVAAIASGAAFITLGRGEDRTQDPVVSEADAGPIHAGVTTASPDEAPMDVQGRAVPADPGPEPLVAGTPDAGLASRLPTSPDPDPTEPSPTRPDQELGTVILNVTPWANVYIDGREQGEFAGKRNLQLAPGKYLFKFVHKRKTTEKIVQVRAHRRQLVTFDVFRD